jgi:hypothetical protein
MTSTLNQSISIAKQIVDESITIDSISEFKSILRIFPNDPALHRVFADLLVRKNSLEEAIRSYGRGFAAAEILEFVEVRVMSPCSTPCINVRIYSP